jgi:hypothetical protein
VKITKLLTRKNGIELSGFVRFRLRVQRRKIANIILFSKVNILFHLLYFHVFKKMEHLFDGKTNKHTLRHAEKKWQTIPHQRPTQSG